MLASLTHFLTYHAEATEGTEQETTDFIVSNKRRVIRLVCQWSVIASLGFHDDTTIMNFIETLFADMCKDCQEYPDLQGEMDNLERILQMVRQIEEEGGRAWQVQRQGLGEFHRSENETPRRKPIKASDESKYGSSKYGLE